MGCAGLQTKPAVLTRAILNTLEMLNYEIILTLFFFSGEERWGMEETTRYIAAACFKIYEELKQELLLEKQDSCQI